MNARFQIRPLAPSDASILAQIHAESFDQSWNEKDFAEFLSRDGMVAIGAMAAEHYIGFILCWKVADESEVLTLAVSPKWRAQGVAHALLADALYRTQAQGSVAMHLEVGVNNAAALALYRSQGFVETGRRTGYYQHLGGRLEDAVTMRKNT